ncbi:potassium-transporting ATPase subunit C [Pseudonocardia xinjiangensis]|uniref:Potassium-transporting ATPase KdpC subunit n=1 Tax=Pseudonocardia xinjiangensis TaxID=75289 RepID=A0ABX1RQY4_9PSEU|nr:potassium-transporting ATPase subunit C [Pseudonocardia xinjiangensis]NMH82221.1 potassium-transporting ATPase subunit C [Pseudonocardia xinjiangensis]
MLTMLWRQTATGLRVLVALTVLCGIVYPLVVFGVAQLPGLSGPAGGSIIHAANGTAVGSSLIGVDPVPADPAADPYFHTRPSASSSGPLGPTDTTTSGGSNKSGFNQDLLDTVNQRRELIAKREGVNPALVPPDAVTASASGLDPDISPAYAALQVARVARVTGLSEDTVRGLVAQSSSGRVLGFLGEPTVNVTTLNLAVQEARH